MTEDRKVMVPLIEFSSVDTGEIPAFDAWRAHIAPFFDVDPDTIRSVEAHSAQQSIANLGQVLIGYTAAEEQVFARAAGRIAMDGLDHFLVQIFLAGGGAMADHRVQQSDLLVIDMAQPHLMLNHAFEHVTAVIPRSANPALSRVLERLHGRPLSSRDPQVRLLGQHLAAIWEAVPAIAEDRGRAVAEGLLGLMTLTLSEHAPPPESQSKAVAAALKTQIALHLEQNLAREVSTEEILRLFKISRATLYRMFAPEGGLQRHVAARRLERAFQMLTDDRFATRRIGEIAWICGFQGDAQFSRAFRYRFGHSPREARAAVAADRAARPHETTIGAWLTTLSRPLEGFSGW